MRKTRQSSTGTKTRVSFNPRARIRLVPTVESYSQEETDAYWYSSEDLTMIMNDVCSIVERMERNQPMDETTECTRGLEKRTRTSIESRKGERVQMLEAVAREYYMQKQYDHDPEVLANMYKRRCAQDQESARLIGTVDEEEALRIFLHDAAQVLLFADEEDDDAAYGNEAELSELWDEQYLAALVGCGFSFNQSEKQLSMLLEDSQECDGEHSINWADSSASSLMRCPKQALSITSTYH